MEKKTVAGNNMDVILIGPASWVSCSSPKSDCYGHRNMTKSLVSLPSQSRSSPRRWAQLTALSCIQPSCLTNGTVCASYDPGSRLAELSVQARQLCWPCINAWTWPFGRIPDAYAAASFFSPTYSSDEIVAQLSPVWTREKP